MFVAHAELLLSNRAATAPFAFSTSWRIVGHAYVDAATNSAEGQQDCRRIPHRAFEHFSVQTVGELDGAMLAAYRASVTNSRLSPASQNQALAALRSFLPWARTMGAHHLPGDVVRTALRAPRTAVRTPYQMLSKPEIADVLRATTTPRDKALLAVLPGAGLRAAEAVGLDVTDVLGDQGKGRKDRTIPFQPEMAQLIDAYLAATGRYLGNAGPLFHAQRISPHSPRHAYAIRALRVEGNGGKVAKLLGRASVITTGRYLAHLALGERRSTVSALLGVV